MTRRSCRILVVLLGLLSFTPASAEPCDKCAAFNHPHEPFKIFGNSYYVGTADVASILIVSDKGHVLIDGDTDDSPPLIVANIKALGFRIEDVRLILNSHVHWDHAGGIAELQRLSHAVVKASPLSAEVLKTGRLSPNDPQYDGARSYPPVPSVKTVADGEVLKVGPIAMTVHFTPGHTPGGTTWTWDSCENMRCLHMVYLDSLNPVSSPTFKFSHNVTYPTVLEDFRKSFATAAALPCDIAVSDHPELSGLWERLERRKQGDADAMIDRAGCRRYVDAAKAWLSRRLAEEGK
jgi:metallo-beta-lactamase class B